MSSTVAQHPHMIRSHLSNSPATSRIPLFKVAGSSDDESRPHLDPKMSYRLGTHVLTVDANVIHKVDTTNLQNLCSMWTGKQQSSSRSSVLRRVDEEQEWQQEQQQQQHTQRTRIDTDSSTVFSKCADTVEQGRRLENISWRLWQREQLCCKQSRTAHPHLGTSPTTPTTTTTTATTTALTPPPRMVPGSILASDLRPQDDMPQLSDSVDSAADDDAIEFTSVSAPHDIARPQILRQDSTASSRSRRDRHITSDDFEKMMISIIQTKAPPRSAPVVAAAIPAPASLTPYRRRPARPAAETTTSRMARSLAATGGISPETQVIRGFSPSPSFIPRPVAQSHTPVSVIITASSRVGSEAPAKATEEAESSRPALPARVAGKQRPALIASFSSTSSSSTDGEEEEEENENRAPSTRPATTVQRKAQPALLTSQFRSLNPSQSNNGSTTTKPNAFRRLVENRPMYETSEAAIDDDESETEADMDESAIEDDDESSEWEDSLEDSGKSSFDNSVFRRVSEVRPPPRRSLISLMLEKDNRARVLASQSTPALLRSSSTPCGPASALISPNDSDEGLIIRGGKTNLGHNAKLVPPPRNDKDDGEGAEPRPIAAPAGSMHHQAALSRRATRRNMLVRELTESLRRNLVRERQLITCTANAVLKRRQISRSEVNLRQLPEHDYLQDEEDSNALSMNQYICKHVLDNGYHTKGW